MAYLVQYSNPELEIQGSNPVAPPAPGENCRKILDTSDNSYGILVQHSNAELEIQGLNPDTTWH
jgi:hypothetical protein